MAQDSAPRPLRRHRPRSCRNSAVDATAALPLGDHLHPYWLHRYGQVVAHAIGDGFVEDPIVTEALVIKLQALEFDAHLRWLIAQDDPPKVRMPSLWAC